MLLLLLLLGTIITAVVIYAAIAVACKSMRSVSRVFPTRQLSGFSLARTILHTAFDVYYYHTIIQCRDRTHRSEIAFSPRRKSLVLPPPVAAAAASMYRDRVYPFCGFYFNFFLMYEVNGFTTMCTRNSPKRPGIRVRGKFECFFPLKNHVRSISPIPVTIYPPAFAHHIYR